MFFHHLKNFSPYSGHIYDDMKVPFIHKKSGDLGRKDSRFDLIDKLGYFPFKELIRNGNAYFISDTDLFEFLNMNESTVNEYTSEYYVTWDLDQKQIFEDRFLNGYNEGIKTFEVNLGVSYPSLPHEPKIQYLNVFCLHCLDFLYFDGDLDQNLFYNLGYLQASLFRGFIEINNLGSTVPGGSPGLRLHFDSYIKVLEVSKAKEKEKIPESNSSLIEQMDESQETKADNLIRTELMCDLEEVKALWLVITAPINTSRGIQEAALSGTELADFLGSAFSSKAFPENFKLPKTRFFKRTSRGDMRNVLNALMYSTYNLNHEYNRSANLIEYATILKQHFPVFSGSEAESIKSVMSTHTQKGMEILNDSKFVNPHIEEMTRILKKHKLLH
ncbi:hypothetical protein [Pedobacter sp. L105]|uniref:hypothetical protein n=1 Tax=Pedobacter sp. L105 TaxID=1641871 RepID=UPI00131E3C60|nr:hypothetical protein [Pedobacter sp. L105]